LITQANLKIPHVFKVIVSDYSILL